MVGGTGMAISTCFAAESDDDEGLTMSMKMGSYGGMVQVLIEGEDAAATETMLLWGILQPYLSKPNAFVSQSSNELRLDACGHSLLVLQSPSSLSNPGVTGSVAWDSGVVLGKFLEHAVDVGLLALKGKKVVELGSGCGLVGCIAALLGANVILTDVPDRLKLLKKNTRANSKREHVRGGGSADVKELVWGDRVDGDFREPSPDIVLGSDVIYGEDAALELATTLIDLCGSDTTVFLSTELRNDTILQYFLEEAMKNFMVGRVAQSQLHLEYRCNRIVIYVLVKKNNINAENDI